jgi:hypothetical protein
MHAMSTNQFQPDIPAFLEGEVQSVKVIAPVNFPPPALPNLVVDPSKPFTLEVAWEVFGALTPLWIGALDARWSVDVYAESIAGGPEARLGGITVDKNTFTPDGAKVNGRIYTANIIVPANTLQEGDPGSPVSGLYKLGVVVFLNSSLGTPGFDLVGYSDGPLIQAENPL